MSLVGWVVILVVVGALVAVPYVFMMRGETDGAKTAVDAASRASDVGAETTLTDALRVAQTWYATNGSLQGFGPAQAATEEPQTPWDASPTAEVGHVSIRGADASSVVLVTMGSSGPLCVSLSSGRAGYGHVDAANASQCAGVSW